jgi:predicted transcriptional regulator
MEKKHLTSVRLSPQAKRLLAGIAQKLGISRTAVLEVFIRDIAKREGVVDIGPEQPPQKEGHG